MWLILSLVEWSERTNLNVINNLSEPRILFPIHVNEVDRVIKILNVFRIHFQEWRKVSHDVPCGLLKHYTT